MLAVGCCVDLRYEACHIALCLTVVARLILDALRVEIVNDSPGFYMPLLAAAVAPIEVSASLHSVMQPLASKKRKNEHADWAWKGNLSTKVC